MIEFPTVSSVNIIHYHVKPPPTRGNTRIKARIICNSNFMCVYIDICLSDIAFRILDHFYRFITFIIFVFRNNNKVKYLSFYICISKGGSCFCFSSRVGNPIFIWPVTKYPCYPTRPHSIMLNLPLHWKHNIISNIYINACVRKISR